MEPVITAAIKRRFGVEFASQQLAARSEEHPHMLATLDGLTEDGEIWEFKAPGVWSSKGIGEEGDTDSLPEHWLVQAQHQMCVAESDRHKVVTIFPTLDLIHYLFGAIERGISEYDPLLDSLDLRVFPVARNDRLIESLVTLNTRFWGHVLDDIPPDEIDPSDAKLLSDAFRDEAGEVRVSQDVLEAAEAWVDLGPKIKELEDERDSAKARVLLARSATPRSGYA